MSKIHLIGHSLGAHVVGFIGKQIQERGYGKIPRITGRIHGLQLGFQGLQVGFMDYS